LGNLALETMSVLVAKEYIMVEIIELRIRVILLWIVILLLIFVALHPRMLIDAI